MENLIISTLAARKKTILVLIFLIITICSYSQPSITWQKFYDSPFHNDNEGFSICSSNPGTYFLMGLTSIRMEIFKINDNGDTLWGRLYDTTGFTPWASIPVENSGCLIVGDGTNRVKIDINGNVIWSKREFNYSSSSLFSVTNAKDAGFIACGFVDLLAKAYLLKFDSSGSFVWDKEFTAGGNFVFYDIIQTYTNGYLVCGYEINNGILIRTDNSGNEIWRKYPIPSVQYSSCNNIRKFHNDYVIAGGADSTYIIRIDTSGNTKYYKSFPLPTGTWGWSTKEQKIEIHNPNKIVVYTNVVDNFSHNICNIKIIDSAFNIIANATINNNNFSFLNSCKITSNGDIIFFGSYAHQNNNTDFYAIRVDSLLNYPPISINNNNIHIPQKTQLLGNFPNPFNPVTKIRFQVNKKNNIRLVVYDILGKEIHKLTDKLYQEGDYEINWHPENISGGIYFCTMYEGNIYKNTIKLIYLK